MREVVLDIETTGLDPYSGHRIIEIGCVELNQHIPTGIFFHRYINPERDVSEDAYRIHGLDNNFLNQYSKFCDIHEDFLSFISDSPLIIHNAKFDISFINMELKRCKSFNDINLIPLTRAIDTLLIARRKFTGMSVSLDSLCHIFNIDNSQREKHSALLDSKILAEVYIHLIEEQQKSLSFVFQSKKEKFYTKNIELKNRKAFLPKEDYKNHCIFLKKNPNFLWNQIIDQQK